MLNDEVIAVFTFFNSEQTKDRQQVEKLLKQVSMQIGIDIERKVSVDELNTFITFSPNILVLLSGEGAFRKINPAFTRVLGFSEAEALNKPFTDFIHPDDVTLAWQHFQDNLDRKKTPDFEYRFKTKSGEWRWIRWHSSKWLENEGMVFTYGSDITDLKQSNQELQKFKNIIENSRDGISVMNLLDGRRYINKVFEEMLGYTTEELYQFNDPADLFVDKKLGKRVRNELRAGKYWRGDIEIRNKRGGILEMYLSGGPVFNDQGELMAVFGIYTDISDRKRYESKLEESNRRVSRILESITDGFFAVDRTWIVTYWNQAAENMLGMGREDILGKNLWDKYPDAMRLKFYPEYHKVMETKVSRSFQEYFDPLQKWFEVNVYPTEEGISVYFMDITDKKRSEKKIQESLREKEILLSEIHHRVKNNLAVIASMLELQAIEEEGNNRLEQKLIDSVQRIKSIANIHEQLYESKSFSQLDFQKSLKRLVDSILNTMKTNTDIDVEYNMDSIQLNMNQGIPCSLIVNEVITNIIKHAFTGRKKGEINIDTYCHENIFYLKIADNGVGLNESDDRLDTNSLGFQLIEVLTSQLNGEQSFTSTKSGCSFQLHFPKSDDLKFIGDPR